ncbi:hypothetical protein B0J17DRAFT_767934 [Rhizoctonia solani]|nr:hypothetical protein B0J17DRAFT_767934 [Rhizoctonia solani]
MNGYKEESDGVHITTPVQQWRAARAQLASAIQTFSTASASLDPSSFEIETLTSGHVDRSLNQLDIEEELQVLATEAKRLEDACIRLKIKRNRSRRAVPINRLSEDILTRVFSIVIAWDDLSCDSILDTMKTRRKSRSVLVLSGVSVAWRYIIVNTSSFWTHLDVDASDTFYFLSKITYLYLERVKHAPVDLHIVCMIYDVNEDSYIAPTLPESLINRTIASLTIESFNQEHAKALAEAWLNHEGAHNLQSLRVCARCVPYTSEKTKSIDTSGLSHITTLRVCGIGANWHTTRLSKLTDLDLSDLEGASCPSMEQLQTILTSNPELHTLRLSDLKRDAYLDSYFKMISMNIRLPRLRFLGIGRLPWHSTALLLQALTPGLDFSCLSFRCSDFADEALELIEAFCSRHKVTTLSLDMPIYHEQNLAIFVRSLSGLHTLNLSNLNLDTNAFPDILSNRSEGIDPSITSDFPRIRRLRLSRCTILASALKRIVVTHPIHWLRMDSCVVFEGHRKVSALRDRLDIPALPDPLVAWLSKEVGQLQITNTDDLAPQDLPWWLLPA